jgi:HK97 family phage major capsid protein
MPKLSEQPKASASPYGAGTELRREFELDRREIDVDARTVPLSFSSEMPVSRYFGDEVLDHSPKSIRLGRLRNGGALLMDHDPRDQVGVVEDVTIEGRRGRAIVRFGRSARAQEIFQDVVDGIRRLVSVGYRIHATETEKRSGEVELVRVTDWEPFEISLVSIPADDSVGVGRAVETIPTSNLSKENQDMNSENAVAEDATRSVEVKPSAPVVSEVRESAPVRQPSTEQMLAAERRRVADIETIAEQLRANGAEIDHRSAIRDGVSVDSFQRQAFDSLVARQTSYNPGITSRSEVRDLSQFSLMRGINSLVQGRGLQGIEREMHEEALREASSTGLALRGQLSLPTVLLNFSKRDMTATGGTNGDQGGTTIQTSLGSFIELLYSKMVIRNLGAQFLTGLQGNLDLPKLLTGSAPVKKSENAALDESSPTTGKISLSPKRNGTFIEVSKQLLAQSSMSIENVLRNDLATALALAMELGAINGGGTDEPTGILGTSGIGSVAGGQNGAAPTWANIVALETAVATANADMGSLAYLTNPKVRGKLLTTPKVASTDSNMVWQDGPNPLRGYRAEVTTQVPSTLEKGSSGAVCSAIIFGNFADLVVAQWGGIDIQVNPYVKDTEGLVRITADTYYDAAVRRAGSFAAMKDALTA